MELMYVRNAVIETTAGDGSGDRRGAHMPCVREGAQHSCEALYLLWCDAERASLMRWRRAKLSARGILAILLGIASNLWVVVFAASNFGESNENWTWFPGPDWQIQNARCVSDETRRRAVLIDVWSYESLVTTTHSAAIRSLTPIESKTLTGNQAAIKDFDPLTQRVIAPTDVAADYRSTLLPWGTSRAWPRSSDNLDGADAELAHFAGVAQFGAPFRCSWGEWRPADTSMELTTVELSVPWRRCPLILPDHWSVLPTIANSVVLALAWRGLLALPVATCSLVRRFTRRGRCVGCGYSRAGIDASSPCPECGNAPKRP